MSWNVFLSSPHEICDIGAYEWVTMLFLIEESVCLYIYLKKNKNWDLHSWYMGSSLLFVHNTIVFIYRVLHMCKISAVEIWNSQEL